MCRFMPDVRSHKRCLERVHIETLSCPRTRWYKVSNTVNFQYSRYTTTLKTNSRYHQTQCRLVLISTASYKLHTANAGPDPIPSQKRKKHNHHHFAALCIALSSKPFIHPIKDSSPSIHAQTSDNSPPLP